jgi:membrane associated rhomboid family serine protease
MDYPVVSATAALATAVTVAWWAKIDVSVLFESPLVGRGQWWRLLTSALPHINVLHLIFNLSWLWVLGTKIERVLGHLSTLLLFLILAIGSGAFEYAFLGPGVGLSGVGYGLFGLLWVLSARDPRFAGAMDRPTMNLFVGWFFLCVVLTVAKVWAVGNVAHGSGAILGILIGFAITLPQWRVALSVTVAVLTLFGVWGSVWGRPKINFSSQAGLEEGQLAYLALKDGKADDGVKWSLDALRYRPNDAGLWFNLGIGYETLGNREQALAAYEKAVSLDPANANYADALAQLKQAKAQSRD